MIMGKNEKSGNVFSKIAHYLFPSKGDKPGEIVRKIIFLTAAVVLVVTLGIILKDTFERIKTNKKDEDRANEFHQTSIIVQPSESTPPAESLPTTSTPAQKPKREVLVQFNSLLERNPDTIGWLTIPGANGGSPWIDYVVVQCDDNDKYLTTDFDGYQAKSGTLFVDYKDKITPYDEPDNIVIYGHNMASGEYFGRLPYYFNWGKTNPDHNDISFYKGHPTLEFTSLYKTSTYKIFAGIMLNAEKDAGDVFYYHLKHNFADENDFIEYCAEVLDRSTFYNPDVNVQYGDKLITLSTCMFGYGDAALRFVLFAREVRPGESAEVDVSKAYANPNPKFYKLYYDMFNYTWNGRKWDKNLLVGYEP